MENDHANDVPYGWWERTTRNKWYSRVDGKVVLPRTIKHKNNYVLSNETVRALFDHAVAHERVLGKQVQRLRAQSLALEKGFVGHYTGAPEVLERGPITVATILEWKVEEAKQVLARLNILNEALKQIVADKSDEVQVAPHHLP